jgi:hypothetical protein
MRRRLDGVEHLPWQRMFARAFAFREAHGGIEHRTAAHVHDGHQKAKAEFLAIWLGKYC